MNKYYVNFLVDSRYIVEVESDQFDERKIKQEANQKFCEADFGEASDVDGSILSIEDEAGNTIWEDGFLQTNIC